MDETSTLVQQRIKSLEELREEGINPFPNDFRVTHTSQELHQAYDALSDEALKSIALFKKRGLI